MRVFVSEFICGGGLSGEQLPDSLQREGRAMLWAVVDDLLQISDCRVSTTLDARLTQEVPLPDSSRCRIEIVASAEAEQRQFHELAATSDAVLVIAPETDGQLADRVRRVLSFGVKSLNCSPEAIELCGDKLRLARHFEDHSLVTLPTQIVDWSLSRPVAGVGEAPTPENLNTLSAGGGEALTPATRFENREDGFNSSPAWVIKPRDGAGSWLTLRVRTDSPEEWQRAAMAYAAAGVAHKALIQPFIEGLPLSVGCHCQHDGEVEVFPIGQQRLSRDFEYLGGSIPASLPASTATAVQELVRRACATIPGLNGHIGFDLLLPDADPTRPLIVEINPRLTTSYVGYRRLSASNLAARWLHGANLLKDANISPRSLSPLEWSPRRIEFDASGNTRFDDAP